MKPKGINSQTNSIPRKAPARRGFTLIELMVVVVIIGILSSMIVAEMRGTFQDALLRSTSRELIDAFNVASSRAITINRPHRIHLDQTAHRYSLERGSRGGLDFVPVRDLPGGQGTLDSRIAIAIRVPEVDLSDDSNQEAAADSGNADDLPAGWEDEISFYPDGTADDREIELRDGDGFTLALRINPITARVQIVEKEPK